MNVCIGIISWLPNDVNLRAVRKERLNTLIKNLNNVLSLPIIIVAQNGKDDKLEDSTNCTIHEYEKLGITKARQVLRDTILQTQYKGVIFLDDDIKINTQTPNWNSYKMLLATRGSNIIEYDSFLFNLLYMPINMLRDNPFMDIDPEKGEGYEDGLYLLMLKEKYRPNVLKINHQSTKLLDYVNRSEQANDEHSTGFNHQFDKDTMSKSTLEKYIILKEELKK